MSPWNNQWSNIHDFNATTSEVHYTLLSHHIDPFAAGLLSIGTGCQRCNCSCDAIHLRCSLPRTPSQAIALVFQHYITLHCTDALKAQAPAIGDEISEWMAQGYGHVPATQGLCALDASLTSSAATNNGGGGGDGGVPKRHLVVAFGAQFGSAILADIGKHGMA
jgi:hypothetical protein